MHLGCRRHFSGLSPVQQQPSSPSDIGYGVRDTEYIGGGGSLGAFAGFLFCIFISLSRVYATLLWTLGSGRDNFYSSHRTAVKPGIRAVNKGRIDPCSTRRVVHRR